MNAEEADRAAVEKAIAEELVRSGMPGRPNGLAHAIADRVLPLVRPIDVAVLSEAEIRLVLEGLAGVYSGDAGSYPEEYAEGALVLAKRLSGVIIAAHPEGAP